MLSSGGLGVKKNKRERNSKIKDWNMTIGLFKWLPSKSFSPWNWAFFVIRSLMCRITEYPFLPGLWFKTILSWQSTQWCRSSRWHCLDLPLGPLSHSNPNFFYIPSRGESKFNLFTFTMHVPGPIADDSLVHIISVMNNIYIVQCRSKVWGRFNIFKC